MNQKKFYEEVQKLGINITEEQKIQLENFYNYVIEWNEKINLTRILNKEDFYLKHYYDSLSIVKIIDLNKMNSICDIGTGAGFPGIVLKIMFPHLNMTLIDTLNKRIIYLQDIIKRLNLTNINAIHIRAEEYKKINPKAFDIAVVRAVSNLENIIKMALPLVKENKYFIAMKGNITKEELEVDSVLNKEKSFIEEILEFDLPNNGGKRTLLKIKKKVVN